jgi:hypothetical protein
MKFFLFALMTVNCATALAGELQQLYPVSGNLPNGSPIKSVFHAYHCDCLSATDRVEADIPVAVLVGKPTPSAASSCKTHLDQVYAGKSWDCRSSAIRAENVTVFGMLK